MNYARNFIFTTGPAFLTMATVKASYNVISSEEGEDVCLQKSLAILNLLINFHREGEDFKLESVSSINALPSTTSGELLVRWADLM